jgi:hypothetical protein
MIPLFCLTLAACGGTHATAPGADGGDAPVEAASLPDGPDAPVEAAPVYPPGSPYRALAIATGAAHTCALLDDHSVKCWGDNSNGDLGYGDAKPSRGATADEMGDSLPKVDLGTGRTAKAIAAGRHVSCALLDDGSVKCWGWNAMDGQPTLGDLGDAPGEMGDALAPLDLGAGRKATHLAAGYTWSCAALDDGSASCWGAEQFKTTAATPISPMPVAYGHAGAVQELTAGGFGALARFDDGAVVTLPNPLETVLPKDAIYAAGSRALSLAVVSSGAVRKIAGTGADTPKVTTGGRAVGASDTGASCVLLASGDVECWGEIAGCHDAPEPTYWCDPTPAADGGRKVLLGQPAAALSTGGTTHLCAILADGSVKCWGGSEACAAVDGGASVCAPPATPDPVLGASVEITVTGDAGTYGAWRSVDLGKRP